MSYRQTLGQPDNTQACGGNKHYDYHHGYIQSGHVVSYPSVSVPTSVGVPTAINYPMNVYQQPGQPYAYQTQDHAYEQKPIFEEGELGAPSFPFSTAASQANAMTSVDVFGSPPTRYAISPGLGQFAIGTPISTPSLVQAGYSDRSQPDYFGRSVSDATIRPTVVAGPPEIPNSDREPSPPGGKKKRGRPKSEILQAEDRKENKDFGRPRLPHIEVERKYRESINLGFEKLRAAVPILPKYDSGSASAAQKQSKAAILSAAIEYIKYLKVETGRLAEENKQLRTSGGDLGEVVGGEDDASGHSG